MLVRIPRKTLQSRRSTAAPRPIFAVRLVLHAHTGAFHKKKFPFFSPSSSFPTCQAHLFLREGARSRGVKKKRKKTPHKSCEKVTREGKLGLGQQVGGFPPSLVHRYVHHRCGRRPRPCENSSGFTGLKVFPCGRRPNASPTTENVSHHQLKLFLFL